MISRDLFRLAGVAAMGLILASCGRPASSAADAPQPIASIQELMTQIIDPSADVVWNAVSESISAGGYTKTQPQTDAEWAEIRRHALIIAESAHLMAVRNRLVTVNSAKVTDEGSPGVLTTAQIQKMIADDPEKFAAAARRLQSSAVDMIGAIDRKDPEAVTKVGGEMDDACEACHLQYWYPHSPRPK